MASAGRQIAATTVVSGVLWALGAVLVIVGVVTRMYGVPAIGLLSASIGAVLNMRGFVMRCEERMHDAFLCGVDHERAEQQKVGVRSVN